ncbi:glycoside hydrolase family 3 N-terminal domain-containing protein [Nafulsella turpanensis]|uniref:glycoside hydrolase family 3 N-terminal domain-containing protein n=1 Tax=Nafulsella turpanensis TaxID=1265690 RepID=UPI000347D454|nr:glycoside hydrolase family 3 N-terminal domain-containing protein [Nafulsella turpanensis]
MRKLYYLTAIMVLLFTEVSAQEQAAYLDPSRPTDERVQSLIRILTLEEKVQQMMENTPAISRLGIPPYNWWNEALHGVGRSGVATVFPQAIGLGATFDDDLALRVASAISDEARAMYNASVEKGYYSKYAGLTFWTPNINIFRDPRWGRGQETYGEDPFLTASLGVAFVKGLQGDHPEYLKTAACAKHFAVHSGPERLRHEFNAVASIKDLRETYLPAFKALVNADVEAVMCAYNATNGEPCCANEFLLNDVLRGEWGFDGHVVSDCGAIVDFYEGHEVVPGPVEAAALALKSGVNLNCGSVYYPHLVEAVKQGLVSEAEVDEKLATLLKTRFRLGMFDPEEANPYNAIGIEVVDSKEHRQLAKEAALKSMVLLKNNGVLPLRNDLPRYFITGPNAAGIDALIGNYYGVNPNMVTMLEGVASHIAPGSQLQYKPGILLDRANVNPIDWTTGGAKSADATIVVLGITGLLEGEEGESIASPHYGDRLDYNLPENQLDFLRKLREGHEQPIIAVITGGSPMNLAEVHELSDAVLLAWYPGEEGGNAVADLIFGEASPSGKLPVTFPKSLEQLPPYEDYSMDGRTYRFMEEEPLYPFGFGLSYADFSYSDLKLSADRIKKNQSVQVEATITNKGKYEGEEVVQLYLTDEEASVRVPLYSLKGYRRLRLAPGESAKVNFTITPEMMALITEEGESKIEKGRFKVYVGGSLPGNRSHALGMARPAEGSFMVR